MCGIVGYAGVEPAFSYLLDGLERLEYRGYDSAGVAFLDENGIAVVKSNGRLRLLEEKLQEKRYSQASGIGHTRWATHGKPSDENAHPHTSEDGRFAVVHNGIIENYEPLKERLEGQGIVFRSQTDSEVIPHLLAECYRGDVVSCIRQVIDQLRGSFALAILCADTPGVIYATCRSSPLIVGVSDDARFVASDIPAVLPYTNRIIQPADDEIAVITGEETHIYGATGEEVATSIKRIEWSVDAAEKGGYAHFMLKEIMEQSRALMDTVGSVDCARFENEIKLSKGQLCEISRVYIVACGSAYHAGMVGKYYMEKLLRMPVEVDVASEFRYRDPLVDDKTLVIIISQSGETADTLAALREAKARDGKVVSIVNVVGSTIARESDTVLYTRAGPEIAVATTKGYTTQVSMLFMLGLYMARCRDIIDEAGYTALMQELRATCEAVDLCLHDTKKLERLACRLANSEHAYFMGRNRDYAVALEASLKLKEISYIHSEAYAAGELKHGTISLIEEGTCVVALACDETLTEKMVSNIKEVKARGAYIVVLTDSRQAALFSDADAIITIPSVCTSFSPLLEIIPMQLLAYYIALYRGCDIDKPRNLAKSVTVE